MWRLTGSSLLTRGKLNSGHFAFVTGRLIPAYAGKTHFTSEPKSEAPAHPCLRGENVVQQLAGGRPFGSSLLTRGKLVEFVEFVVVFRLIPAYAGKTAGWTVAGIPFPAHPCLRGENELCEAEIRQHTGSSLLTRGKRTPASSDDWPIRLIPAYAGKTSPGTSTKANKLAHPCLRGENYKLKTDVKAAEGSSLLTRGKHATARLRGMAKGLIPAYAGKTTPTAAKMPSTRAHPCLRGENRWKTPALSMRRGSSLLTRGKPLVEIRRALGERLIPAYAGKTPPVWKLQH